MEEKALDTLKTFFTRRGLPTDTESVTTDQLEKVNLYTMGKVLIIFPQKDKITAIDINNYSKFAVENGNTQGIVVATRSKPSENVLIAMKARAKDRMQFFHLPELQYDITSHRMSMPHRIMKPDEATAMMEANKVSKPEEQIPWIDSQDIQARVIGAIPGDILEIIRHSDSAGRSVYYRYCVADVNVA
jgi:DNA-directed RNA polymerase subunit H (RpoH/RPB5)